MDFYVDMPADSMNNASAEVAGTIVAYYFIYRLIKHWWEKPCNYPPTIPLR